MALKDGKPFLAFAVQGGDTQDQNLLQFFLNFVEFGMDVQEAVEAPRVWTQGHELEVEPAIPDAVVDALTAFGHEVLRVPRIAGGMNAVAFEPDGTLTGAACWRADGTPVAISGGLARPGVRFTLA